MKLTNESPMVSDTDDAATWVFEGDFPGVFEARYVRRYDDRFIAHLSSQSGCKQACRFCHLTQSGQTDFVNADVADYLQQAATVLRYYDSQGEAEKIHFNFMARGDVFANPLFRSGAPDVLGGLAELATSRGLFPEWKLSTTMPKEVADVDLARMLMPYSPDIYYSLYSADEKFRKHWLPKAMPVAAALQQLRAYQEHSRKIVCLHWALIAGENDDPGTISGVINAVRDAGLRVDINFVRYNPFSAAQGSEPTLETIDACAAQLREGLPDARVKVIPHIGRDVKADCGMFVNSRDKTLVPVAVA